MVNSQRNNQKITGEHFYKFFQCPHWIWYDIYEDQAQKKEISPLLKLIYEGRFKDEKKAISNKKYEELEPKLLNDLDEAFIATLNLMKQGKNIYRGVLLDGIWTGMPDLLEVRPIRELKMGNVKSVFGDYYYAAYDIRDNSEMKDEYKFPLVLYTLILEKIQGIMPREAFIINSDGEAKSFFVEDFIERFHINKEKIEKILSGEKPPPFLKSGCKHSPWFTLCSHEAKDCGDVSLIYGLSQSEQRQLYEIGIKTVKTFAETEIDELNRLLPNWYFDRLNRHHNQARVLISEKPVIIKKPELPQKRYEIYFDIESDPTENLDYLFGVWIKNTKTGKGEYKYFLAKNESEKEKMWKEFIKFISDFDDFVVYHYAYYEKKIFEKLSQKYGTDWETIRKFKKNAVDLLKIVVDSAILPLYFYSLKDVAQYLGYKWKEKDAGGAESVIWHNDWQKTGDEKIIKKILNYNKDDVLATLMVKEWLEKQKPQKIRLRKKLPEETDI